VNVAVGDVVSQGDRLVVLEAMKMEHSLTAPRDGVVAGIHTAVGDQVQLGACLIQLEPDVTDA
jgi:3-methylcrotonyl-CoA carboxylase alpha subunit